jgi:cytoskeleton protein RodZ
VVASEAALAFGQELQLERERREVTLGFIAEVTKVPQRHLLALETEQFEMLPGGIFTKGIVRSYCRTLGLDEEEWLSKLPGTHQQEPDPEWTEFARNVSRTRIAPAPRMRWRWGGVLLMLLSLGGLGWGVWRYMLQPQIGGANGGMIGSSIPALNLRWADHLLHRNPLADPSGQAQRDVHDPPPTTTAGAQQG